MSDSSNAASAGSRRARPAVRRRRPEATTEVAARDVPGERERVPRRRRVRPRDDDKKEVKVEEEESGDEDDKKTKSSSSSTTSTTSKASSTTLPSSSATTTTLSTPPPPPPPPAATTTPARASITPPQAVTTAAPTTAAPTTAAPTTSSTPAAAAKTTAPLSTLTDQGTLAPTSSATSLTPGQAQTQPDGSGRAQVQRGSSTSPAAVAFAVIGSLAAVSLIAFFLWRWGRRRRRARDEAHAASEKQYFPPKSDIRIMDEAMAAVYGAEGGSGGSSIEDASSQRGGSRWSQSTPGWFRRQVNKVTGSNDDRQQQPPARPKEAAVNKWMDRHTSRMLDPMAARASFVSSAPSDLGPPPSISPASVVGGNRESVLSEMGQIRRAAVPPPLDLAMVDRVKRMQEDEMAREQGQAGAAMARGRGQSQGDLGMEGLPAPPPIGGGGYGGGIGSPSVYSPGRTEITWNTWGVDQHAKR